MRLTLALIASAVLSAACYVSAFNAAASKDTSEAYRLFLRENPEDGQAFAARSRLAELELEAASKLHTVVGYKRFLEEFADRPEAEAARARLEGLRFNAARQAGTVQALRAFVSDHPNGAHRGEADLLLQDRQLAALATEPAGLAGVGQAQRNDPRAFEAAEKLDDQAFETACNRGAGALLAYLRDYISGAHREEARLRLLELELESLFSSGLLEEAQALAGRSPLAQKLPRLAQRVAQAKEEASLRASTDPTVKAAQPAFYLRALSDLESTLKAPDPLDRWQAAEELGQHVSVKSIEPLLMALRQSRSWLVRQRAFESLGNVLRALPKSVADYELATRLEVLRARAGDAEVHLAVAVLLDLSGRLAEAATEYQKAFDRDSPDPVVLHRWAEIRLERREYFSAAVAARSLALWASAAAGVDLPEAPASALGASRQLCGAFQASRFALEVLAKAKSEKTEFPEDLIEFEGVAREANRLAGARLKDAELLLRTADPYARLCEDRQVADRLAEAVQSRQKALRAVALRLPKLAPRLLALSAQGDPSPAVRAFAAQLAAGR